MFVLRGHTALVTGGTQGVGGAIAIALAQSGANVIVHGLARDANAEATLEACRKQGVQAEIVVADLSIPGNRGVDFLFEQAMAIDSSIDLLVNNAGTFKEPPFLSIDLETLERTMRLNLYAGFFLTQSFVRHWIETKVAGRVLFTGSINGILSEPDHVAYDASKGAVAALVRSLCASLAPIGIRVNSLAPGLIRTPLTNQVLSRDPAAVAWMKLHTPNREVPTPDVCGPAAVFLLSDEAAHIHGQTLLVDGGMSAWQQPDLPGELRSHFGND